MSGLDNELCPFCGGDRIEVIKDPRPQWVNWYVAVCIVGDPCGAIGPARRTKAEAIAAWNTRAALRQPAPDAAHKDARAVMNPQSGGVSSINTGQVYNVSTHAAPDAGDMQGLVEPSNAEQAEWPDATFKYVHGLSDAIQSLTAQVRDDHPEYVGSPVCKIASYNYCHEQALGLGYPAIDEALNALEDLTAQLAAERAKVVELVEGLMPFKRIADHTDGKPKRSSVGVNVDRLRDARALIERSTAP